LKSGNLLKEEKRAKRGEMIIIDSFERKRRIPRGLCPV